MSEYRCDPQAVHAGQEPDPTTGSVTPPIHMTTTFKFPEPGPRLLDALFLRGDQPPHVYTRWSNPSLRTLEEKMAALEGGDTGVIVEDVVTTGGSSRKAIEEVEAAGLRVQGVITIIDRMEGGAQAFAERGHDLQTLLTIRDFGIDPPND